jgi:hypothetical protein
MFQMFYLFQTYIANVLSGCFKGRSGVASRHSPTATAEASRVVHVQVPKASAMCIRRRAGGHGVMVSPCGREMGAGGGSAV